jgi:O-antigen chain-terminating methyltransferase
VAQKGLTEELAARVREAVAQTAPARPPDVADVHEDKDVRRALDRAAGHATPTVPEGAPLARWKRLAVRLLRFLWRDQSSFNALTLEAAGHMVTAIARERQERARFSTALERRVTELSQEAARRAAIQDGRLASLEASGSAAAPSAPAAVPPAAAAAAGGPIPPGVYALFEEKFRGAPDQIARTQRSYLPLLEGVPGAVLDVGCGRGEFLRLLASEGIPARGVEINPVSVEECRRGGLDVRQGDALEHLRGLPASSLGAVVAFQVVEHWTPEAIFAFLREARRALAPGGVLICETVNVDTFSAWRAFWLDFSHVRPVPSEALAFLAGAAGFVDARVEPRSPLPEEERLEERGENERKLNRLLFAPQDYALIARAPGAGTHG